MLGDHWNILIIREACLGVRRFDDFQASLNIGRNILTRRLNALVDDGMLKRVEYQNNPPRNFQKPTTITRRRRLQTHCNGTIRTG